MNTYTDTVPAVSVLTRLRALAHEPVTGFDHLRSIAAEQAALLGTMLHVPLHEIPERITTLIPSIRIEYIANIPLPGIAFWASSHWHIHIRATDPVRTQVVTVLHELKRIIDHPLHAKRAGITCNERQVLAALFARDVLAAVRATNTLGGRL